MKIVLLGANGRTGREILGRALDAGDQITALVRTVDRLSDVTHARLTIRAGNVCDAEFLKTVMPGHDVAISTLGPRTPTARASRIYSDSAVAIVEAMQAGAVTRLLVTSTALLFPGAGLLDRVLRFVARHNARNAGLMEAAVSASRLDWTIARIGFLNSGSSMEFRLAEEALPDRPGSISRAAVAHFLLTEAKQSSHVNRVVGLCG